MKSHSPNQHVFKPGRKNSLKFVGNFEEFYREDHDPWNQSGTDQDAIITGYYQVSRARLAQVLDKLLSIGELLHKNRKAHVLEVGCGLGYVVGMLQDKFEKTAVITGLDVSQTAVKRAKRLFPGSRFVTGDITATDLKRVGRHEIVILNQVLWYLLEKFEIVFDNLHHILRPGGALVISTAFLENQRYGREIIDGFDGLLSYMAQHHADEYALELAKLDTSKKFLPYIDGLAVFRSKTRKISNN